jgi:hypothetical protein
MMAFMGTSTRARLLKQIILLFWALWISAVVLLNIGDLLKVIGLLPSDWRFASGNYHAIVDATNRYALPRRLDLVLFAGIIVWETLSAGLFWRAFRIWRRRLPQAGRAVYLAVLSLFALFATFILADELFHDYRIEGDHRSITLLLLASLLVLVLLPERE